jgi:deoxyribodipyrimidine photo-lyase
MAAKPFVYCFSTDLRLDDHAGVAVAAAQGEVLPLLVVDDLLDRRLRVSPRRAAFFCGAVAALSEELQERGSRLIVRRGERAQRLAEVIEAVGAAGAAWSASYDAEGIVSDRDLRAALEERGYAARIVHDAPAISPEEIDGARGGSTGYRAFAPFFDRWWALPVPSYEHPLLLRFVDAGVAEETLPQPRDFGSTHRCTDCGARAARRSFERFLAERAGQYATAAAIPAECGTSRLSAHLSFGTISARTVVRRVREAMGDPFALAEQRHSLKLFLRELARRDFFLQLSWFHPQAQEEALQEKMRGFIAASNHPGLDAWRAGRTGYPLVDAGIRQLNETGWMHPHVRAVAASFLCFDLAVDWRVGRAQWDGQLTEDEPALATGNWQWIAGVGADMAQFPRIYNPERQRRRCDPDGSYVGRWIPELRHLPPEAWNGRARDSLQLPLGLFDGDAYPRPILEHAAAARHFLERYRDFVSP